MYGNAPPNLPTYMASLALSQTSRFGDGSSLLSRLSGNYRDHYADTVFGNSFFYTTPSYILMNLFFDYTFANPRLDLTFAVQNLADRAEVSYRFTNQYGGETTQNWVPAAGVHPRLRVQILTQSVTDVRRKIEPKACAALAVSGNRARRGVCRLGHGSSDS